MNSPPFSNFRLLSCAIASLVVLTTNAQDTVPVAVPNTEKSGLLTEEIDGEGNVSMHVYDDTSSLDVVVLPEGLSRAFESSQAAALPPTGMETSETNPAPALGPQPVATFSEMSSVDSRETIFVLGPDGKIIEARQGEVVTTLERDANGQITQYNLPSGQVFDMAYDERGNLVSLVDVNHDDVMTISYDPTHNLPVEILYSGGGTLRGEYDPQGNLVTSTSPAGRTSSMTYQEDGLLSSLTSSNGLITRYEYDSWGNLIEVRNGEGADERSYLINRDVTGRITRIDNPEGQSISYTYSDSGELAGFTDYDGEVTVQEEDDNGNNTAIIRPADSRHNFTYDGLQRLVGYEPPGQPSIGYRYNVHSDPLAMTVGGQNVVATAWNSRGQLISINESSPESAPLTGNYVYDDDVTGQLLRLETGDGITLTPTYDGDFVTRLDWSGETSGSFEITFDNGSIITSNTVNNDPPISYTYDADILVTSAGDLSITRDPLSGLVQTTALGVVTENFEYNTFGELISQTASISGSEIFSATHTRDKLGRVTQIIETIEGTAVTIGYAYDSGGRISEVTRNGMITETYSYDRRGNLVTDHIHSYTYNGADQLLTAGDIIFTYTATGERLSRTSSTGTTKYSYTPLSTLRSVELADGSSVGYLHDGAGSRAARTQDGTIQERYLCPEFNVPIAIVDAAGSTLKRYVYAFEAEAPCYILDGGATYLLITDHLSSVRLVVDTATGNVLQRIDYDVYGKTLVDSSPGTQPFGFAGGWTDPSTGLIRFGARDYDPEVRRWTTQDPILFLSGSLNNYAYVDSDPVNFLDPTGLNKGSNDDSTTILLPLYSVASVDSIDGDKTPRLFVRRNGKGPWAPIGLNTRLSIGDELKTNGETIASLRFDLGGRANLDKGSTIRITAERNIKVIDRTISLDTFWERSKRPKVKIQAVSGAIGIRG